MIRKYFSWMPWGIAVCVVIAVAMGFAARNRYATTLEAKVFPSGKSVLKLNVAAPGPILLLGDSRIARWNCPEIEGRRVVNAGFPGITSAELASGCGQILAQTHPQIVVVQVGINDLKLLGVRPQLREAVISNCVSSICDIVRQSKQAGAHVIVTAIWPPGKVTIPRRFVWNSSVTPAVATTNLRLQRALAMESKAEFFDIFGEMTQGMSDSQREELYSDTLHLNDSAYAQLTPLLAKELRQVYNRE
jgi:lysophospholipase L1-like esterase